MARELLYTPCSQINCKSDYETGSPATNPRLTVVRFGRWSLEVIGVEIKRPQWTSERLKEPKHEKQDRHAGPEVESKMEKEGKTRSETSHRLT